MYGLGYLAVFFLPLLATAAPAPEAKALAKPDNYEDNYCCTITTKADYPANNPDGYFAVNCLKYEGLFYGTSQDYVNLVWRAECHNVAKPPDNLHEVSLTVINVDCKPGPDACDPPPFNIMFDMGQCDHLEDG
ncbi:hypothetical protein IWZ00DRAFT_545194 [Phyllosticta capitalensis]